MPPRFARGAGDGVRTRDLNLGKVALYQLSYSRIQRMFGLWTTEFSVPYVVDNPNIQCIPLLFQAVLIRCLHGQERDASLRLKLLMIFTLRCVLAMQNMTKPGGLFRCHRVLVYWEFVFYTTLLTSESRWLHSLRANLRALECPPIYQSVVPWLITTAADTATPHTWEVPVVLL